MKSRLKYHFRLFLVHFIYLSYSSVLWLKLIRVGKKTGHKESVLDIIFLCWSTIYIGYHLLLFVFSAKKRPPANLKQFWYNIPLLAFIFFNAAPYGFTMAQLYNFYEMPINKEITSDTTELPILDSIFLQFVMPVLILTYIIHPLPNRQYHLSEMIGLCFVFANACDIMSIIGNMAFVRKYGFIWETISYFSISSSTILLAFPIVISAEDLASIENITRKGKRNLKEKSTVRERISRDTFGYDSTRQIQRNLGRDEDKSFDRNTSSKRYIFAEDILPRANSILKKISGSTYNPFSFSALQLNRERLDKGNEKGVKKKGECVGFGSIPRYEEEKTAKCDSKIETVGSLKNKVSSPLANLQLNRESVCDTVGKSRKKKKRMNHLHMNNPVKEIKPFLIGKKNAEKKAKQVSPPFSQRVRLSKLNGQVARKMLKVFFVLLFTDILFAIMRLKIILTEKRATYGFNMLMKNIIMAALHLRILLNNGQFLFSSNIDDH